MGKNHSKVELEQSELPSQIRILSPLDRWNQSQHTLEDVAVLLQMPWKEWTPVLTSYLKIINNKEKYQLYTTTILEHLRQQSTQSIPQSQNKQLFNYYSLRLAHSFFVVGQFHQAAINLNLKSKQKLLFLYEYYSLNQQQFQRAMVCNYPSILIDFPSFVSELIQNEIIIKNMTHFKRFILSSQRGELIKNEWEIAAKFYPTNQRQKILEDIRIVVDLRQLYLRGIQQFMKYDNADAACQLICQLQLKGYKLTTQDQDYYIKISLFGLFIYSLGKISLNYSQFSINTVQDIIHLFYSSQNIEDTPQLLKCLQVASQANQANNYLLQYCFSTQSHISVMIRLLDHGYISFKRTMEQYQRIREKVRRSRTQVGKYTRFLINLITQWELPQHELKSLNKLLTLSSIMNIFGLNLHISQLIPFIEQQSGRVDQASHLQEQAVKILKLMISGFFSHSEIQNKSIEIQDETYTFVSLYDLLHFLKFIKDYMGKNTIKQSTMHQILFKQLVKQQLYQQINVLLREQNLKTYNISFQTVQLLIIEHLIELITTKKIRKIEPSLSILSTAIRLQTKKETNHYVTAYYKYFKYLEDKDIHLPQDIRQNITLKHLYYIADKYPNKLQSLDFNYLFIQQSCIRQHYSQKHTVYVPAITEEFLKFKIYLCSKCFSTKKIKLGYELIDQILICEPPWLSTQLIKILKEPGVQNQIDENFINIAFKHCRKAEDLEYIIKLKDQVLQAKKASSSRLSIKNIKKLSDELIKQEKFICLDNQIITHNEEYINLIAEVTFGKDQSIRTDHLLFFKLLAIEPMRAFNYALNYNMPVPFLVNFLMEGIKRSVIQLTNPLPLLVRFLYFKLVHQQNSYQYIKYKQFCNTKLEDILSVNPQKWSNIPSINSYLLATYKKMVSNYQFSQLATKDFVEMYIVQSMLFKFYYEEGERKRLILQLRQQPMTRNSAFIFRRLCTKLGIDIVQLSVYELISRVNSNDQIDEQAWEVIQKLIFWGEQRKVAFSIVIRLSQKIETLQLLVKIYDYIRQREAQFKDIITEDHLSILVSLSAIERDKNLFGIIPQTYFNRPIGVYNNKNRGYLSQNHRKILQHASITNIFVLSKALYLMYGCDQEIEKVVLGEFSLRQPDSQQFQLLRKKIKLDSS